MAVFGDFAGQPVRLDNAATEETLQRLVDIAQQGFGNAGSSLNAAATGANNLNRAQRSTAQSTANLGASADASSASINSLNQSARSYDRSMARYAQSMRTVGNSPLMLAETFVQTAQEIGENSGMLGALIKGGGIGAALGGFVGIVEGEGNALQNALTGGTIGAAFGAMPGVMGFLSGTFLRVLNDTSTNFTELQKNGALLGGSMLETRVAAHGAGLTMSQFSGVMKQASAEMSLFGGQTLRGAKMFGDLSRAIVEGDVGRSLLQMGIGFEEQGVRTAEFIAHLAESGVNFDQQGVSIQDATKRVKELATQQKALAALNGTTIEQEKEKQRAARKDAQLNAVMLGLNNQQREGIQQLTGQFPQFSQFIKETIAFGGPVSKGALMQQAQMGATTEALGNTISQILAGGGQGAIDAFKQLQETSPALQADLQAQAELVKLGIVTQNDFIQTANDNFQTQFENFTKANNAVLDSILEDQQRMSKGTDTLTNTMITLQQEQQALLKNMTVLATEALSNSEAVQELLVGTTKNIRTATDMMVDFVDARTQLTDADVGIRQGNQGNVSNSATRTLQNINAGVVNANASPIIEPPTATATADPLGLFGPNSSPAGTTVSSNTSEPTMLINIFEDLKTGINKLVKTSEKQERLLGDIKDVSA